jgi:hypothetical protein
MKQFIGLLILDVLGGAVSAPVLGMTERKE